MGSWILGLFASSPPRLTPRRRQLVGQIDFVTSAAATAVLKQLGQLGHRLGHAAAAGFAHAAPRAGTAAAGPLGRRVPPQVDVAVAVDRQTAGRPIRHWPVNVDVVGGILLGRGVTAWRSVQKFGLDRRCAPVKNFGLQGAFLTARVPQTFVSLEIFTGKKLSNKKRPKIFRYTSFSISSVLYIPKPKGFNGYFHNLK